MKLKHVSDNTHTGLCKMYKGKYPNWVLKKKNALCVEQKKEMWVSETEHHYFLLYNS